MMNSKECVAREQREMYSISPADDTIFPPDFTDFSKFHRGCNGGVDFMNIWGFDTSPAYAINIRGITHYGPHS